jgi:hypothetical protein
MTALQMQLTELLSSESFHIASLISCHTMPFDSPAVSADSCPSDAAPGSTPCCRDPRCGYRKEGEKREKGVIEGRKVDWKGRKGFRLRWSKGMHSKRFGWCK